MPGRRRRSSLRKGDPVSINPRGRSEQADIKGSWRLETLVRRPKQLYQLAR